MRIIAAGQIAPHKGNDGPPACHITDAFHRFRLRHIQESGKFAYESVLKERTAKSEKISVSANGLHYNLPTDEPGNYIFELRDDQDRRLTKLQFCVVGRGAVTRSLEKNAELQVKLDIRQFNFDERRADGRLVDGRRGVADRGDRDVTAHDRR